LKLQQDNAPDSLDFADTHVETGTNPMEIREAATALLQAALTSG